MLSLSLFDFPSPTFTSSYKPKMCLLSGDSKLAGSVDVRACFCLCLLALRLTGEFPECTPPLLL